MPAGDALRELEEEVVRLINGRDIAKAAALAEQAVALAEQMFGPDHHRVASALNNLAEIYRRQRRFEDAERYLTRSIKLTEAAFGPADRDVGISIDNLALLYQSMSRYEEAEREFKRSFGVLTAALPGGHPDIDQVTGNLARFYLDLGRFQDSAPLYGRLLENLQARFGEDHPEVIAELYELGRLFEKRGRYVEAEDYYQRALFKAEQVLGTEHQFTSILLNALGESKRWLGQLAEAEPLFRRCIELYDRILGDDDGDIAVPLNNLALTLELQGRHDEAEPLYKRSLAIKEVHLGPSHPDFATTLENIANLYSSACRYEDAEAYFLRAIEIYETMGPRQTHMLGRALANFGKLAWDRGKFADAEALYQRATAIYLEQGLDDHPEIGVMMNQLANVNIEIARYVEAEALCKKSIEIFRRLLGEQHPHLASALNSLAVIYHKQGRSGEAKPLLESALDIRQERLGRQHPDVGATLSNLATIYASDGEFSEAEHLLKQALAIRERALGSNHPAVSATLNAYGLLCIELGRYQQAEQFLKRAVAIDQDARTDHFHVAIGLFNLGTVYRYAGRHVEAEHHYREALAIGEAKLGVDHFLTGRIMTGLAQLCSDQGNHQETATLTERASRIPGWDVADVPIHFATNQQLPVVAPPLQSGARSASHKQQLTLGIAVVRAPTSAVLNRAERAASAFGYLPNAMGRQTNEFDLTLLRTSVSEGAAELFDSARERGTKASRFPNQALLYVHGYNNSFDEAVRRTAMITFDLGFDGAAFVFTWPSFQRAWMYGSDRKRARKAVPFLVETFATISRELPHFKVHVFAHSTGAEIALNAFNQLLEGRNPAPRFGELILAHADAKPSTLARVLPALKTLGIGVTSYSSKEDVAMTVSRLLRWGTSHRIGGQPVALPEVDAIDITGLGIRRNLNHNVFVRSPLVFGDIARLLSTGKRPPHIRTRQFKLADPKLGIHWTYEPAAS